MSLPLFVLFLSLGKCRLAHTHTQLHLEWLHRLHAHVPMCVLTASVLTNSGFHGCLLNAPTGQKTDKWWVLYEQTKRFSVIQDQKACSQWCLLLWCYVTSVRIDYCELQLIRLPWDSMYKTNTCISRQLLEPDVTQKWFSSKAQHFSPGNYFQCTVCISGTREGQHGNTDAEQRESGRERSE